MMPAAVAGMDRLHTPVYGHGLAWIRRRPHPVLVARFELLVDDVFYDQESRETERALTMTSERILANARIERNYLVKRREWTAHRALWGER